MKLENYINDKNFRIRTLCLIYDYIYDLLLENHFEIINGDKDKILDKIESLYYVNKLLVQDWKKEI